MLKSTRIILIFLGALLCFGINGDANARKIKNTLRIDKDKTRSKIEKPRFEGKCFSLNDSSIYALSADSLTLQELKLVEFSGYDKEPNSNQESFILVNSSPNCITGYKVRIDYLDMQGRMLHSRELMDECFVPAGENRRFDTKSWDLQHTYYYYLGNEPKKVATPFQVSFTPLAFWIIQSDDSQNREKTKEQKESK